MASGQYSKILVISLHKIGDNLQVTPVFRALKGNYPSARVSLLTERQFAFPFEGNPFIDDIRFFDRTAYANREIKSMVQGKAEICPVLKGLQAGKFDLVINRQSSIEGAIIAGLVQGKETRGLYMRPDGRTAIDDQWTRLMFAFLPKRRHLNPFNFVDYSINICGGINGRRALELHAPDVDVIRFFPEGAGEVLAVQPGSLSPVRQWGIPNFTDAIRLVLERSPARVLLLGSPGEAGLMKEILAGLPESLKARVTDTSRDLPLAHLPSVLKKCRLLLTNDTGTMHMAAASGTPVIALYFGESFVNETGPYGPGNLVVCSNDDCVPCMPGASCEQEYACKKHVSPEAVGSLVLWKMGHAPLPGPADYRVYTSGDAPLPGEIRYRPLFPVAARPRDILRYTYLIALKENADREALCRELAASYTGAARVAGGMADLDVSMMYDYCRDEKEIKLLAEAVKQAFLYLREGLKLY